MAVQLPTSKSGNAPPQVKAKRNFWPTLSIGRRRSAYRALRNVDSPVKSKGSRDMTSEDTEDVSLLKAGDPTAAKYAERLSHRSASAKEEPFVPRPNSRITFKLPDNTPSEDMQPEGIPEETAIIKLKQPNTPTQDDVPADGTFPVDELVPANDHLSANDMPLANKKTPDHTIASTQDAPAPASDPFLANDAVFAHDTASADEFRPPLI